MPKLSILNQVVAAGVHVPLTVLAVQPTLQRLRRIRVNLMPNQKYQPEIIV
jgi:hypothetical protein